MKKIYAFIFLLLAAFTVKAQWQQRQAGSFSQLGQNSANGNFYAASQNKIYESTDKGSTWTEIGTLNLHPQEDFLDAFAVNSVTGDILVGVDNMVTPGAGNVWIGKKENSTWAWGKMNTGLPGATSSSPVGVMLSGAGSFKGKFFLGLNDGGVYVLDNGSTQWTLLAGNSFPAHTYVNHFLVQNNIAYMALDNLGSVGGIWRSTDGVTWEPTGFNGNSSWAVWWMAASATNTGPKFLATSMGDNGIYQSTNGQTWTKLNWFNDEYNLRYVLGPEGEIYASYTDDQGFHLEKSIDNGESWSDLKGNLPAAVQSVATMQLIDNQLTLLTNNGIYQRGVVNGAKDEFLTKSGIGIYPNPSATGSIYVTPPVQKNYQIAVYDARGNQQKKFDNCAGTWQIDTKSWKSGLYVVQITKGAQVRRERVAVL